MSQAPTVAANGGSASQPSGAQADSRTERQQESPDGRGAPDAWPVSTSVGRQESANETVPAADSAGTNAGASKSSPSGPKKSHVPDWIMKNLKDPHSWKMVARCWLASWVCLLLMLPNRSLQTLGQAAFFTCIVSFMIPSNMPVMLWLFANFTLVLGACLGWAWGAAGMAASLRARDQVLLASQVQRVQAGLAGATNPEAEYTAAIFRGAFLDPRASAVYGVFLVTGAFAAAVMMAKVPKLKMTAIFAIIVGDIMLTYGAYFPIAQYTLATIFLLPIGASLGISFACMLFVFPESLNYSWTRTLVSMLRLQRALLGMHAGFVADPTSYADAAALREFDEKLKGASSGLVGLGGALSGQAAFLELDVSRGRLSGKDLRGLLAHFRGVNIRLFGLAAFPHLLEGTGDAAIAQNTLMGEQGVSAPQQTSESWRDLKHPVAVQQTSLLQHIEQRNRQAEADQHVELSTLQPIMAKAAKPTLDACGEALDAMIDWIDRTNSSRWLARRRSKELQLDALQRIHDAAQELARVHKAFINEERLALLRPYEQHFKVERDGSLYLDEQSAEEFRAGGRPLFLCLVWCVSLSRVAVHLAEVAQHVHELASKRDHNRIWLPRSLRALGKVLSSKKAKAGGPLNVGDEGAIEEHQDDEQDDEQTLNSSSNEIERQSSGSTDKGEKTASKIEKKEKKPRKRHSYRRDPDAMPPSNPLHYVGRAIVGTYNFMLSPTGLFGVRMSVVSFALWIPAVIPSSSAFSYQERQIWALIMGQLGLAVTTGEQIFSTVARIAGTVIGGLLGAAMWYISQGQGHDEPYTYALVGAVFFIPFVFLRVHAPMAFLMPAIMIPVTAVLVYGYSWINTHLPVQANSGVGIEMFWRRTLLVIIGFAAATAVIIIGRPVTTRGVVRQSCAHLTSNIVRLYSSLIEAFIEVDSSSYNSGKEKAAAGSEEVMIARIRPQLLELFGQITQTSQQLGMASIDFSPRGHWPKERYVEILRAHARMAEGLAHLAGVAVRAGSLTEWQRHFFRTSAILEPAVIADITLHLSLISRALASGTSLPHASTATLLDKVVLASIRARKRAELLNNDVLSSKLSLAALRDKDFMETVAALSALMQFVRGCDKLAAVTASLVGEVPLEGYDALLNRVEDQMWAMSQRH